METEVISQGTSLAVHADFSLWALFAQADWIVRSVIIILLLASLISWAIIIDKFLRFRSLRAKTNKFEDLFWSGKSLENLHDKMANRADHPMALMFISAMEEWQRSTKQGPVNERMAPGLQERIGKVMRVTEARELDRAESYLGFLATVGSTAPFIGLFGTVWGIMSSFQAIADNNNTTLAVVAPGIAEALFATALGLLAAIPAVIAYNNFIASRDRLATRLDGFAEEFEAILSRQLDEGLR